MSSFVQELMYPFLNEEKVRSWGRNEPTPASHLPWTPMCVPESLCGQCDVAERSEHTSHCRAEPPSGGRREHPDGTPRFEELDRPVQTISAFLNSISEYDRKNKSWSATRGW